MKSLAANRLEDGITVWATLDDNHVVWTENWIDVVPAASDEEINRLETFAAFEAKNDRIVSERLIDVLESSDGGYIPQRLRERICTQGPTIRKDLGKQAQFSIQSVAA